MTGRTVSLIVPAYNAEPYVADCLNSIREQSFPAWEAVIVDDGSTDRTGEICDRFARLDSRFRVFHTPNAGASRARNTALQESEGDIIGFADADDTLGRGALERVMEQFRQEPIDALFTGYHRTGRSGAVLSARTGRSVRLGGPLEAAELTLDIGPGSYTGVVWNKYFRRECVCPGGRFIEFDPGFRYGEDQLWLLLAIRNIRTFSALPDALYNYRVHEDSIFRAAVSPAVRRTEIGSREKMLELTEALYPSLLSTARVKYRACVSRILRDEIRGRETHAVRALAKYGKQYYREYMHSREPLRHKVRETLLQAAYLLCGREDSDRT
jgi:glycosyltransferase involved in cell wall biosynthesis